MPWYRKVEQDHPGAQWDEGIGWHIEDQQAADEGAAYLAEQDARLVACDECDCGRVIVTSQPRQGDVSPCYDQDVGECPTCKGRGTVEINVEPITLDDTLTHNA